VARRLILDTSTLIAYERRRFDIVTLDDDDLAIAAVTVAELRTGIELADTAQRAADRARVVAAITATMAVLDYTEATAVAHGRLLAHVRRTGAPRGAHDLIVASHAVDDSRAVLSLDAKARFGDLPGVLALAP
jgi:tRNA(fMet)-specific endonuclease VapC